MTTWRLGDTVWREGDAWRVEVVGPSGLVLGGCLMRLDAHEVLVRFGGRLAAFQEHEKGVWTWTG